MRYVLNPPVPQILAVAVGLLVSPLIVFAGPRLAADRLPEPPELPSPRVLVPLAGGWLAGWRPFRTLALELGTAAVLLALSLHYRQDIRLPLAGLFCLILITIADIDFDFRLVLNRVSYPAIVVALIASAAWPGIGLARGLLGAAAGLVIFGVLVVVGRGALGMGDLKLAVLVGAMRGFPGVLDTLIFGVVIGGLAAAFLLLVLRRGRKEKFAYAPYLALGAILSFFLISP